MAPADRECSGSLVQMLLTPLGLAACLLPGYPVPLPGPQGFCSFPKAACRVGWDSLILWS